jgi:hypothetical protein
MKKDWYLQEYSGLDAIPYIVSLVSKVKTFPYTSDEFAIWLTENINNVDVKIHIVVQDKEIVGFGIAELCTELNTTFIAIQVGYVPPDIKGGVDEWLERLSEWAKEVGAKSIKMKVRHHVKGWAEKYKFEIENYTLRREV